MSWYGVDNSEYFFQWFSISHFIMISLLFLGSMIIFLKKNKWKKENLRTAEIPIAISLIIFEIFYHIWMYQNGIWQVRQSLPLELCSISLILTILLLLTRKKIFYEILLFTALLGASQALFTPLLHFDFPHFRFIHFFYTHLMMIWVAFYFTWAKGYRPTIMSVFKLIVFLNMLMPVIC